MILQMIELLEQANGEGPEGDDVSMEDIDMEAETDLAEGDADVDDQDAGADRSAKAEAIQKATQKKREIDREKKLQKHQYKKMAEKRPAEAPQQAPGKRTKQASSSACVLFAVLIPHRALYLFLRHAANGLLSSLYSDVGCCTNAAASPQQQGSHTDLC